MEINRILCPLDFSDSGDAVNEYASTLASATGATLIYLHVTVPDINVDTYATLPVTLAEIQQENDRRRLKRVKPTVEGVQFQHVVQYGFPKHVIVQYAIDHDVDLIVLGTHGRTGLTRLLMGSVAERVVRNANCPVMAIKPVGTESQQQQRDADTEISA